MTQQFGLNLIKCIFAMRWCTFGVPKGGPPSGLTSGNEGRFSSPRPLTILKYVENFQFISQRGEGEGYSSDSVPEAHPSSSAPSQKSEDIEEDVPF